jgi:hypothetical protein
MVVLLLALLSPVSTINSQYIKTVPGMGKAGYNPDKMICVARDVTGSRLQQVRECHTAQQWRDQAQQERTGMIRKQFNGDPGCNEAGASACNPMTARDTPW